MLAVVIGLLAQAADSSSPKPPPPPKVELSGLPATAVATKKQPDGKPHPVTAYLLADVDSAAPGDSFRLGVYLVQKAGWHTYWKSPGGDIGLPTEIRWTLPAGATASPYAFPVPQRFEASGIVSYGYEDQVLLFSTVTVPADTKPGTWDLVADANWLVCETSCIPGEASLKLPVQIGPRTPSRFAPLFDHFATQHPTDPLAAQGFAVESALSASAVVPNQPFKVAFLLTPTGGEKLAATTARWPTFTHINTGWDWSITDVTVKPTDAGGLLVVMHNDAWQPDPLPTDAKIGGLFQVQVGERWVRTEIERPLPWAGAGAAVTANDSPLWQLAGIDVKALVPGGPPQAGGSTPASGSSAAPASEEVPVAPTPQAPGGLLGMLLGAFVGGLILNVMPCVLPVLTLKLYSLVGQRDIAASEQRSAGIAYTAGILVCFWVIAGVVVGLQLLAGEQVGWGFMFQSPSYVATLTTIVFAFGLSLVGVFEIPAIGVDQASRAGSREGPLGFFLTGVFAVLVATPCTAPFLGSALAVAFAQPPHWLVAAFTMVGLGLASPFLLIAFVPALYGLLPRPGAWMETFKQFLGLTMIATAAWLLDVLSGLIGGEAAVQFTFFLCAVGVGCWVFGRFGGLGQTLARQVLAALAGVLIAVPAFATFVELDYAEAACDDGTVLGASELDFSSSIPWQPFSEERVRALAGKPVFIDFTADWCWSCKVNERGVLETAAVRGKMAEKGIVPLRADWTRKDETISTWLRRYGKVGVPFYLVLPADGSEPIPLPEVLTTGMVVEALERAG